MSKNDFTSTSIYDGSSILFGDCTIPGIPIPKEFEEIMPHCFKTATEWGLDYYEINIEWMAFDGISEVAAYDGFPQRYPHWRFGMAFEELSKGYEFGMQRIYEMVINNKPCTIYFLNSNTFTDNVLVLLHALGHSDFFKNNIFFKPTNTKMMNELGNNRTRIMKYIDRWGEDRVEAFIDDCHAIETLVDPAKAWHRKEREDPITYDVRRYRFPRRLEVPDGHEYMEDWLNPKDLIEKEKEEIRKEEIKDYIGIVEMADKDVMGFLRDNAPLKPWEQDILSMLYDEAMYFQPQRTTKVLNEGWACIRSFELMPTNKGFLRIGDIFESKAQLTVDGGETRNWFKHENHDCIKLITNRGLEIEGSVTHRLLTSEGIWKRLDEFKPGDGISISYGSNVWTNDLYKINWSPSSRMTWKDISEKAGCSMDVVLRYKQGLPVKQKNKVILSSLFEEYDKSVSTLGLISKCRKKIKVPRIVDEQFASFLGHLTGDGHISKIKREVGLTTGVKSHADEFVNLVSKLFGLKCRVKWDDSSLNGRYRVRCSSMNLQDLLVSLGMPTGYCARIKKIPDCVLQSPKKVMSAFLRSYFDCDAGAYDTGIILSSSSPKMVKMVQVVLLNYGILSRRYLKDKDNWHVTITGKSAKVFLEEIGFGIKEKQLALESYVNDRKWFLKESLNDEVVSVEPTGKHTVYDITVEDSHRYSAQGFINHNSYVDFNMMARIGMPGCSIWDYADHKSQVLGGKYSQNPYKIGFELFMEIEDRWNKGQFGWEWEQCKNMHERERWNKNLNFGHQKVFDVREHYNDVTAIAEFFTEDFCNKHNFFNWERFPSPDQGVEAEYRIVDRDWRKARDNLISRYLNGGLPYINLVDPNGKGKNIFVLEHKWDGRTLQPKYSKEVMKSLSRIWRNPVALLTKNNNERDIVLYCTPESPVRELKRSEYQQL